MAAVAAVQGAVAQFTRRKDGTGCQGPEHLHLHLTLPSLPCPCRPCHCLPCHCPAIEYRFIIGLSDKDEDFQHQAALRGENATHGDVVVLHMVEAYG